MSSSVSVSVSVSSIMIDEYCDVRGGTIVTDTVSGGEYACTLNQTELDANANKFYIMQVVKDSGGKCYLFTRYGRIGLKGRAASKACASQTSAISEFTKQFTAKT